VENTLSNNEFDIYIQNTTAAAEEEHASFCAPVLLAVISKHILTVSSATNHRESAAERQWLPVSFQFLQIFW